MSSAIELEIEELVRTNRCSSKSILHEMNRKSVVLFLSSTFTDTTVERNYLMEKCFPRLRRKLQSRGIELQVVDMRWGIREEHANRNLTSALCMAEIERAKAESQGVFFVSLIGDKYGYRPLPRILDKRSYEIAHDALLPLTRKCMEALYELDQNAVPPCYVIRDATYFAKGSFIGSFVSTNLSHLRQDLAEADLKRELATATSNFQKLAEERLHAGELSLDDLSHMIQAEISMKLESFPDDVVARFIQSVTEEETRTAFLDDESASSRVICVRRRFKEVPDGAGAGEYFDVAPVFRDNPLREKLSWIWGQVSRDDDAIRLRERLTQRMLAMTRGDLKFDEEVDWKQGVNADADAHKEYLRHMADFVSTAIASNVDRLARERAAISRPQLVSELLHHAKFADEKLRCFVGRAEELQRAVAYLEEGHGICVVTGQSGTGKTAFVAKVFSSAKSCEWKFERGILRFLGTSAMSGQGMSLLSSSLQQLGLLDESLAASLSWEEMKRQFLEAIQSSSNNTLFCYDSLDQLDNPNGERTLLEWLPTEIPSNVRFVVSCIDGSIFDGYSVLSSREDFDKNRIALRPLDEAEITKAVTEMLGARTLQPVQRALLDDAVLGCKLALYMRIATDMISPLRSSDDASAWCVARFGTNSFPLDVRALIRSELNEMAKESGQVLVRRLLRYVTLANVGLSMAELEDVLSLDDDVLDEVFEWWVPPLLRLPPSLLSRVLLRVRPFLVVRDGAGGAGFLRWYHRHHLETVQEYIKIKFEPVALKDHGKPLGVSIEDEGEPVEAAHAILAGYFGGKYADGKTYYGRRKAVKDSSVSSLRLVPQMPWNLSSVEFVFCCDSRALAQVKPNARRAYEQIYHLARSGNAGRRAALDELMRLDAIFAMAVLKIVVTELVRSLRVIKSLETGEGETAVLAKNLFLFASTLTELEDVPGMCAALASKAAWFPALAEAGQRYMRRCTALPNPHGFYRCSRYLGGTVKSLGERLVLRGHQDHVESAVRYGDVILSGSKDNTVRAWDAETGVCIRVVKGNAMAWALCIVGDSILVGGGDGIRKLNTTTWMYEREMVDDEGLTTGLAANDKWIVAALFSTQVFKVFDVTTSKEVARFKQHSGAVRGCALDGDDAVSVSFDNTIALYRVVDGEWKFIVKGEGHTGKVRDASFNESFVATASDDMTVRIWSRNALEPVKVLEEFFGVVPSCCFYKGLLYCAGGSADSRVHVVDPQTWTRLRKLVGHYVPIEHVSVWNDEVYTSGHENTVRVWPISDWTSGNDNASKGDLEHDGHFAQVFFIEFFEDELATCGEDRTVRLWKLSTGEPVVVLNGPGTFWCCDFDSALVVAGNKTERVMVWDRKNEYSLVHDQPAKASVSNLRLSPRYVAFVNGSSVALLSRIDWTIVRELEIGTPITSVWFEGAALWGQSHTLRKWNADTGEIIFEDTQHYNGKARWRVSPCGGTKMATVIEQRKELEVFDWERNETLSKRMSGHSDRIYQLRAHDRLILTVSQDRTTRLWDWVAGSCVAIIKHSPFWNTYGRLVDGGRTLVLASQDGSIRFFESSGKHVQISNESMIDFSRPNMRHVLLDAGFSDDEIDAMLFRIEGVAPH